MPLVKNGAVVEDRFVRVLDDAAIADDVAVIVPAAGCSPTWAISSQRSGATGVLWPNDRDVSELAPHLDRLALVALVFPNFRDGRAYSQARILRERHTFRGELRATGQVLRDQFLLLASCRLRCIRSQQAGGCFGIRRNDRALQRRLPAGRRGHSRCVTKAGRVVEHAASRECICASHDA